MMARSRSTSSSLAIAGSNPQRSNRSRSNNLRLGSLCPKISPTNAVIPSDALTSEAFVDIHADFGGTPVGAARQEFFEIEPADHATVAFRHPKWMLIR